MGENSHNGAQQERDWSGSNNVPRTETLLSEVINY